MNGSVKSGLKIGGIVVAAAVVIGGAIFGGQALGNATGLNRPAPSPTVAVVENAQPGFADTPATKTPPPVVVVEAPPVVEAAPPADDTSGGVSGRKVPFIPSDDPQNAAGGDWDMSVCEGGSASTGADGTPYCD